MKKILKTTRNTLFCGIGVILLLYLSAFMSPKPEIGRNSTLEMYDINGELFYTSVNEDSGQWVSIDQVSPDFLNAIIDIEDKHFYYHQGFDLVGIARALWVDLKQMSFCQGASTISQQCVKNIFLTNEKTWQRKLREAWLTLKVETHYDKAEILESYINTVYFGAGIYGIQNASQYYFSKDAVDLNMNEATILAGMVNGPELYSPIRNPELTKERQKVVLNAMHQNHHLSTSLYQNLMELPLEINLNQTHPEETTLSYYRDTVLEELASLGFSESQFKNDELKIYTSLDLTLQAALSKGITATFSQEDKAQTAVVILKPNSGAIMALTGGRDYATSQYNRALYAQRQMASTVKPFLYYEALANGFTPISKFVSEKTNFRLSNQTTYAPTNYNDLYPDKEITMLDAIATSDNIYAVKTHLFLGEKTLATRLKSFGYDATALPSLALGTLETSPMALAKMYNCLASQGTYYEQYCIERIENKDGKLLYEHQPQARKILDADLCLVLNQMLTSSFDEKLCDVSNPTMLNYRSEITYAAKTGTSDWDSWTVAFNPNLTIAIWVGFDDNEPLEAEYKFYGRDIFATINKLYKQEATWYEPTKNIVQIPIDPLTGEFSSNGSIYWFYQPILYDPKQKYHI